MSLSVSGFYKSIKESFKNWIQKKILFISVAGAIVVVAILLVLLLGKNSYAVLYRGCPEGASNRHSGRAWQDIRLTWMEPYMFRRKKNLN